MSKKRISFTWLAAVGIIVLVALWLQAALTEETTTLRRPEAEGRQLSKSGVKPSLSPSTASSDHQSTTSTERITKLGGVVTEQDSNEAVASCQVILAGDGSLTQILGTAYTEDDGSFEFPVDSDFTGTFDSLWIVARKPSYRLFLRALSNCTLSENRVSVALQRALFISGSTVTPSGSPVADVQITASRIKRAQRSPSDSLGSIRLSATLEGLGASLSSSGRTVSGADGRWKIDGLAPGRYLIETSLSGWTRRQWTQLKSGRRIAQPFIRVHVPPSREDTRIVLEPGYYAACAFRDERGSPINTVEIPISLAGMRLLNFGSAERKKLLGNQDKANVVIGVMTESYALTRNGRTFFGVHTPGHWDKRVDLISRPIPSLPNRIVPDTVTLERDNLNSIVDVQVRLSGPAWISELSGISVWAREKPSALTKGKPAALPIETPKFVALSNGMGHMRIKTGKYEVRTFDPRFKLFDTIREWSVFPDRSNTLDLKVHLHGSVLKIVALSPAGLPADVDYVLVGDKATGRTRKLTPLPTGTPETRGWLIALHPGDVEIGVIPRFPLACDQRMPIPLFDDSAATITTLVFDTVWGS